MALLFLSLEPLCVVVEFVPGGSLDQILRDSRIPVGALDTNYVNVWSKLSERELLKIASDVSNGMRHLESKLVSNNLLCVLFSTDLEIQLQLSEYFVKREFVKIYGLFVFVRRWCKGN